MLSCQFLLSCVPLVLFGFGSASLTDGPSCRALQSSRFIQDCSVSHDVLELHDLSISPVPQKNHRSYFHANGTAHQEITSEAEVKISVFLGPIPIFTFTNNLCSSINDYITECPIPKGEFSLDGSFFIPSEIPTVSSL